MSNLIINGNFSQPVITSNTFLGIDYFTAQQKTAFYWTDDDHFTLNLLNQSTAYEYEYPSIINTTQYLSFQFYGAISQQINLVYTGEHVLKFQYCNRPSYPINPLYFYLNNELIYTVSSYTTTWLNVLVLKDIKKTGLYTLRIVSNDETADKATAICNVQFYKNNNIITNSYFTSPSIFLNTYVNVSQFYSPEMYNEFYWSYDNGTTGLITFANGLTDIDSSGFTAIDLRVNQYIVIQNDAYIYQNVNIPVTGNYIIKCLIYASSNSSFNRIKTFIDGVQINQIPNFILSKWTPHFISSSLNISAGPHEIKLLGVNGLIAISHIEMIPPSSYIIPLPAPAGMTDIQNNSFKNTNIYGKFNVKALVDTSGNTLFEGVSTMVPRGDTCSLFIGDNNYYDGSTHYGLLSITRPNATYGNHMTRPHIGLIRRGRTVFQMGYCEKFNAYQDNFSLTHSFGWTNAKMPGITFTNTNPNKIGINNYNPTEILDVSGNAKFGNDVSILGNLNVNGSILFYGNNKFSKFHYDSDRNITTIGSNTVNFDSDTTGGGLIQNKPAPIWNKNNATGYVGNGYFFNTNAGLNRTDFINYSPITPQQGGFDFWVSGSGFAPRNIASISLSGNLTLSGSITTTNDITTSAGNVFTSTYLSINNLVRYGETRSYTTSTGGTTVTMAFPISEIIMFNSQNGTLTLRLPDTSSLSTSASCKFVLRRISSSTTNVLTLSSVTGSQLMNQSNTNVASISGISNGNIVIILFNKLYYISSYA